jgi:hypothetical protein
MARVLLARANDNLVTIIRQRVKSSLYLSPRAQRSRGIFPREETLVSSQIDGLSIFLRFRRSPTGRRVCVDEGESHRPGSDYGTHALLGVGSTLRAGALVCRGAEKEGEFPARGRLDAGSEDLRDDLFGLCDGELAVFH